MKEQYVLDLFVQKKNVISQVKNWKDKFENFQLALGGVLDGRKFTYSFKDDFGGQCWSRSYLSEAMWGIYANDPTERYLRIRSTPRKLLAGLTQAHASTWHQTCFLGKVSYCTEKRLIEFLGEGGPMPLSAHRFAQSLLLKRRAFRHENEVRLLFFGNNGDFNNRGLYRYDVDPHTMITQIMADPNRNRTNWKSDKSKIRDATGFTGQIKRSKTYDPPVWQPPIYTSGG